MLRELIPDPAQLPDFLRTNDEDGDVLIETRTAGIDAAPELCSVPHCDALAMEMQPMSCVREGGSRTLSPGVGEKLAMAQRVRGTKQETLPHAQCTRILLRQASS